MYRLVRSETGQRTSPELGSSVTSDHDLIAASVNKIRQLAELSQGAHPAISNDVGFCHRGSPVRRATGTIPLEHARSGTRQAFKLVGDADYAAVHPGRGKTRRFSKEERTTIAPRRRAGL